MKIFQLITKSSLGGAQSVVVNLANALCRLGHEVVVVAGPDDGKMWNLLAAGVKKEPCRYLQRSVSPVKDVAAVVALRRLYRKYRPDVVHLHSSKAGMLGRMAFPARKIVYTVHGFDSIRLAFRSFLPIERIMQYRCRWIVGVSQHDVRTMGECGITRHVTYVHNGILQPLHMDEGATWDIPSTYRKKVLCIARLSPPKNWNLFMQVAVSLPEYAFIWIGNQEKVANHPSNVFFLGNIPQAGRYCGLCDLFILPSNYEGFPMVILEAMSYGVPVVASNVGGVAEAVVHGETGFVVKNSVAAFSQSIKAILEDDGCRTRFSEASVSRLEREFTVERMLEGYLKLYGSITDIRNK